MRFPRHPIQIARNLVKGPPPPGIPKRALKRHLPRDPVILEAGAHRGVDTVELARTWKRGQIHAFEPIPDVYRHLQIAVAGLPNVLTYQLALGDTTTTAPMHVSVGAHDGSSSLLPPSEALFGHFPDVTFSDGTLPVEVTTIAEWAEREGVSRIDGMWLDMQGYELQALKAAGPILSTVRVLAIEVSVAEIYAGLPLWPEVREWLESQGFGVEVEDLYHEAQGDALLVRAA